MVPRSAAETDIRLLFVTLERGNVHCMLTCFILFLHRQMTQTRVDPGICFFIHKRSSERAMQERTLRMGGLAPIKPRKITDGIIYHDELEWCGAHLSAHRQHDIVVREMDLQPVHLRKVVCRFRGCEQGIPSLCPKKIESHTGLRGAVVSSLQQAEPNLIAAFYAIQCKCLGRSNDDGVTVEGT